MTDKPKTEATTTANEANVTTGATGAHDRVAMLSLKADGTPDQLAPEIIGDKEFALEATKRQFAEQAVSAADDAKKTAAAAEATPVEQDPAIAAAQKEHADLVAAAEKTATDVVDKLHKG